MSDTTPILHHYPESPFAEKARLMLGFKNIAWHSVTIPIAMPKPDLMALTGGYRRTPVLQVGADIYCDTALIARVLDRIAPAPSLHPDAQAATVAATAAWADSVLFGAGVAWAMQPAGLQAMFGHKSAEEMAVFAADRKQFREGATVPRMGLEAAGTLMATTLARLQAQFERGAPFLFGDHATVADFAVHHPLWFVGRAGPVAAILDAHPAVRAWMKRLEAHGHGAPTAMSAAQAIEVARAAMPAATGAAAGQSDAALGRRVIVAPSDYGIAPSEGVLVGIDVDEWVIARDDPRAGRVHVHVPRTGFTLAQVD